MEMKVLRAPVIAAVHSLLAWLLDNIKKIFKKKTSLYLLARVLSPGFNLFTRFPSLILVIQKQSTLKFNGVQPFNIVPRLAGAIENSNRPDVFPHSPVLLVEELKLTSRGSFFSTPANTFLLENMTEHCLGCLTLGSSSQLNGGT
ncbi:uncharacterized protein LOC124311472 isoform X2 [Daphnia pulicaria]|uniref:uncharacterized protein LOC124311472 isoform X2 n=1 Tax=Daphnia pulicaria TaxID=35523 RepID=UPI001EEB8BEB|nr:uncharacterized protein LOC124311472 isoform X2 [Daphnia pulicaria]